MALWTYSDWITQTSDATRLERLRLHIQEVSEQTMESDTPGVARIGRVDESYLKRLMEAETALAAKVATATRAQSGNCGRNRVSLRRWP